MESTHASPRPPLRARVDSRAARARESGSPEEDRPGSADDGTAETLTSLADDLRGLTRIRLELLREQLHEAVAHGRRALGLAIVGAAAVATGVVYLVRGASEGAAMLLAPERTWIADLATGAVVLATVLTVHLVREALRRGRRLRRLKRKLEPRS